MAFCIVPIRNRTVETDPLTDSRVPAMFWTPIEAQVDDILYNIRGFELPMLVQKAEENTYRFLGPCYEYPYMNGEALVDKGRSTEDLLVV